MFVSDMFENPWGGSEELWWETAMKLVGGEVRVRASVIEWSPLHAKVQALIDAGVEVFMRPKEPSLASKVVCRLFGNMDTIHYQGLESWLRRDPPSLVVLNGQFGFFDSNLTDLLQRNGWPYICVSHSNAEFWWPTDEEAAGFARGIAGALKMYFVSEGNRRLAAKQVALPIEKTGILRNPFGVNFDEPAPWTSVQPSEMLEIACVGRLDPHSKGQDLLIEALASPGWIDRKWTLNLYGSGPFREAITRVARAAGVSERVVFKGHTPVSEIYAHNHVLALPSRAEGLPITIVEAMLSGRAVVTTDVAGNAELLEEGVTGFIADAPAVKRVIDALDRMWERRGELEAIGLAAHHAARRQLSRDPAADFAEIIMDSIARTRDERVGGAMETLTA